MLVGKPGTTAVAAQNVNVVSGQQYRFSVTMQGISGCSTSGNAPFAIWRIVNGSASGNYGGYNVQQICAGSTYNVSGAFTATHTGAAQLILWVQVNSSQAVVHADNLSVSKIP